MLLTHCDAGVRVGGLNQLFALMSDHPVWINLSGSLWIQVDHLKLPEVCDTDGVVLRTHVEYIWYAVVVEVVFAGVPSSITFKKTSKKVLRHLNSSFFLLSSVGKSLWQIIRVS